MEQQPVTQGQRPQPAIIFDDMAFDHLWLRFIVFVDAIQRVVDQKGVIARDIGSCKDGIEHREIGLRHEL
jgi:hypothetical protein